MKWQPPIPAGAFCSPAAIKINNALPLLGWCYDQVGRDGWLTLNLHEVAGDLGIAYHTVKNWWKALSRSEFIATYEERGRGGMRVRIADAWIDWRILAARKETGPNIGPNSPEQTENGTKTGPNIGPNSSETEAPDAETGPDRGPNTPNRDKNGTKTGPNLGPKNLHIRSHPDHESNGGGGIQTRARVSDNVSRPPPPPGRADQELPQGIAQSAAEWLNHPLKTAERRQLLTLLGAYGADWLEAGIVASVAQGGRSLNYLTALLEGCRRDDRPPGSPKTNEQRNGTHHSQSIGNRQPARAHAERARWSEADLDQPL